MKEQITITEQAAKKVIELSRDAKKEGYGLKVIVVPGGCSGFQYGMDFAEKPEKTDKVIQQHKVKIFVDKESLDFLKGSKIDYIESLQGAGFEIDNPNVTNTCGCGKSVC